MSSALSFSPAVAASNVAGLKTSASAGRASSAVFGTPLRRMSAQAPKARMNTAVRAAWSFDEEKQTSVKETATKLCAGALAGILAAGPMTALPALANEFDILSVPTPGRGYVLDDAKALSRAGIQQYEKKAADVEKATGYKVVIVTVRKLQFVPDAFEFADKVIENWYPTAEQGDKKAVILLVTSGKEGALVGGPSFSKTIGDNLLESIVLDNIPVLTGEERYTEAALSVLDRVNAKLQGLEDPGPPVRKDKDLSSNFKTREETLEERSKFTGIVGALLVIAFIVPMVQFYAYTRE